MEPKKTTDELLHAMQTIATAGPEIRSDGTMDSQAFRKIMSDISLDFVNGRGGRILSL